MQDHVYRQLCELILNGEIAPGRLITIQALADAFGVSAMPVREALQRLTAAHVLTVVSGRTIGIPPLNRERLEDLRRVRLEVESIAAMWATPNIGEAEIEQLAACVDAMGEAARAGDRTQYVRLNRTFHFTIYGPPAPTPFLRSSRIFGCRSARIFTCSTRRETTSRPTSSTSSCLLPSGRGDGRGEPSHAQRHRGRLQSACVAARRRNHVVSNFRSAKANDCVGNGARRRGGGGLSPLKPAQATAVTSATSRTPPAHPNVTPSGRLDQRRPRQ